jgi:hypothetical protein
MFDITLAQSEHGWERVQPAEFENLQEEGGSSQVRSPSVLTTENGAKERQVTRETCRKKSERGGGSSRMEWALLTGG